MGFGSGLTRCAQMGPRPCCSTQAKRGQREARATLTGRGQGEGEGEGWGEGEGQGWG